MEKNAVIILDPGQHARHQERAGQRRQELGSGGNCTVSCMLMGVGALYKAGLVEWMSTQTYQAASGGGAQHMRELLTQYGTLNAEVKALLDDPKERHPGNRPQGHRQTAQPDLPPKPPTLACRWGGSLIPWIDKDLGNGHVQGRVEGHGRDQQDSGHGRRL